MRQNGSREPWGWIRNPWNDHTTPPLMKKTSSTVDSRIPFLHSQVRLQEARQKKSLELTGLPLRLEDLNVCQPPKFL